MLSTLLAIAVFSQGSKETGPTPAQLVSRMLIRYSSANSLAGTINYTQSAGNVSIHGKTEIQYVRPNKLYIRQSMDKPEKVSFRVVSDGEKFAYSIPQDLPENLRTPGSNQELVEPVKQLDKQLSIGEIYTIGSSGLLDKSPALDIAIGRIEGLKMFRSQLATLNDEAMQKVDGIDAHVISGDWRQYESAPVSGTYRLAVTDSGDLLFFSIKEIVADPQVKMTPQEIVTAWRADLKVNGPTDSKLFKR